MGDYSRIIEKVILLLSVNLLLNRLCNSSQISLRSSPFDSITTVPQTEDFIDVPALRSVPHHLLNKPKTGVQLVLDRLHKMGHFSSDKKNPPSIPLGKRGRGGRRRAQEFIDRNPKSQQVSWLKYGK
ncbi:uncharacterized protein LOC142342284 [Convolutriloba macropyga]|uniref:uncharacterized protein LOC142342284 n=1 Tax=Convolutriloba macropyga TaxID=536237 RepID=UPI003F528E27